MANKRYKIDTKFGSVYITPTERDHIYVGFGYDSHYEPGEFQIRRVKYCGNMHLYLWHDGKFRIGQEDKDAWSQRQALYMSKRVLDVHKAEPSEAARETVKTEVLPLVLDWIAANVPAILEADREYCENKIADKLTEIKALHDKIESIGEEITALRGRMTWTQ
jgi:hypothetical protein